MLKTMKQISNQTNIAFILLLLLSISITMRNSNKWWMILEVIAAYILVVILVKTRPNKFKKNE